MQLQQGNGHLRLFASDLCESPILSNYDQHLCNHSMSQYSCNAPLQADLKSLLGLIVTLASQNLLPRVVNSTRYTWAHVYEMFASHGSMPSESRAILSKHSWSQGVGLNKPALRIQPFRVICCCA